MNNPMDKVSASHIRAYCVKEDLQKLFFQTNIKVYSFDSKFVNEKDSIVIIAFETQSEAGVIAEGLKIYIQKHGDGFRDIEIDVMTVGNLRLQEYLDGGV